MIIIRYFTLLFLFVHTASWATSSKISSQLTQDLAQHKIVDLYLLLTNQTPIKANNISNRVTKIQHVVTQLKHNSKTSKNNILPLLHTLTTDYKFYWINNSLLVKLPSTKAQELIASPFVAKAYSNSKMKLDIVKDQAKAKVIQGSWNNINHINAPSVWSQGFRGQNVLIAGQDTGYEWQHVALKAQYAGWNALSATVDHNYHWHDAIASPIINCRDINNNPESCDDHGHGTHTMGTMIGSNDNFGNPIGVAPDAKWIGCRNMDIGNGTPSTYTECFQFFLEPTDLNNLHGDVSKAPHIINNSWGCPESEGCTQPDILASIVNNTVAAGILVVAAAGNSGPGCNSIDIPPAFYAQALTIGSTTANDAISIFSSQGGITIDGSNRIKPNMVAPGSNINSANLGGGYTMKSGTSMAAPHVVGVAALMISANPSMAGKPKILKQVLLRSSHFLTTSQTCSGVLGTQRPNNTFGYGRLDALAAVNQIKDIIYLDNFEEF